MIVCIHGRTAADPLAGADPSHVDCLDCEELTALRELEATVRRDPYGLRGDTADRDVVLEALDDIRRRKGIGALGHPETRDIPDARPIGVRADGTVAMWRPPADTLPDDGVDEDPVSA